MPKAASQECEESKNGDREGSIQSRACMVGERGERICNHCQSSGPSLSLLASRWVPFDRSLGPKGGKGSRRGKELDGHDI